MHCIICFRYVVRPKKNYLCDTVKALSTLWWGGLLPSPVNFSPYKRFVSPSRVNWVKARQSELVRGLMIRQRGQRFTYVNARLSWFGWDCDPFTRDKFSPYKSLRRYCTTPKLYELYYMKCCTSSTSPSWLWTSWAISRTYSNERENYILLPWSGVKETCFFAWKSNSSEVNSTNNLKHDIKMMWHDKKHDVYGWTALFWHKGHL